MSSFAGRNFFKPRPNDCNISTQHIATLLSVACCARLATLLGSVATCCDMLGVVGSNLKMVKFFMQHLWMLRDVVVVWPGSYNNVAPGHVHWFDFQYPTCRKTSQQVGQTRATCCPSLSMTFTADDIRQRLPLIFYSLRQFVILK